MTTYSLTDVVTQWGLHEQMKHPEHWLQRQIRSGKVRARKVGHHWRMTQADIDHALDSFANTPTVEPAQPEPALHIARPSTASLRRRRMSA